MRKPSLLVIFLTVFIDLIGFGIVLPLLPRYSEKFGAGGFMIGTIIASFSVMQFLFAPAWGRLSDRIGRRPVLLVSNCGSAVSYGLFALAAWPALSPGAAVWVLLASRVFGGACGANLSVASAYIADVTPREGRSKGMALIGVAFGLGFILGPALGAISARHFGLAGPGWVAAALCTANFLLACVILAESRRPGCEHVVARPRLAQWGHVLRQPRVGVLIVLYALSTFCFACYESTLPLLLGSPLFHPDDFADPRALARRIIEGADPVSAHLRARVSPEFLKRIGRADASPAALRQALFRELNRLTKSPELFDERLRARIAARAETRRLATGLVTGDALWRLNRLLLEDAYPGAIRPQRLYYDEQHIGWLFAYCGLVTVLVQGGLIGRLVKRFGEARMVFASLLIIAVSVACVPYVSSLGGLLAALALFSLGTGINRAPTMGLISLHAAAGEQGATLGVAQSAGTLARIVGPVCATTLYTLRPHAPYLLAAGVAAAAGWLAWRHLCRDPRQNSY